MRIISGKFKGRKLSQPLDKNTRPLKDVVKESVFNLIVHSKLIKLNLRESNILDLFSGSGSFGIECLSRGSTYCKFIDNSNESINTINKNLGNLNIKLHSSVIKLDAIHPPATTEKYGLSFFDPPYSTLNFSTIIARWEERGWFAKNAICIYEKRKDTLFSLPKKFFIASTLSFQMY